MSPTEVRGKIFTRVYIRGATPKELGDKFDAYLKNFPKAGYSTRLVRVYKEIATDLWEAEVSRYSSCD